MIVQTDVRDEVFTRFPEATLQEQQTADGIPTFWVDADHLHAMLRYLQRDILHPYAMLYDLTAIDERERRNRHGQPDAAFTVVYQLRSYLRNADVRIKVALPDGTHTVPTVTDLWPAANWYEREVWDMFGIAITGYPNLTRILLPPWWDGHPLRKEYPARATEMGVFQQSAEQQFAREQDMQFHPEAWGMRCELKEYDCLYLNIGPHHPGTHGVLRIMVQLDGQEIVDLACEIGFHHRGAEKMGERQSWHTYIPYTDRVDYLAGVQNNFPYVLAVEQLAGITIPARAKVIRILMAELFRIISHLVFLGTFAQDLGMMSPVFYMFTDREHAFHIVEAVTGARMHPGWFRIGGVAQDLPVGWEQLVRDFIQYMRSRLDEYDKAVLRNHIFRARTKGIGAFTTDEAISWGATGPMLRSTGMAWDVRKARPYGGYEQFDFDVPVGSHGDCYDRAQVHLDEMRQSLRIMEQCLQQMPDGPHKADHPLTTPPDKTRMLRDIETLIDHFVHVSWGPVIPAGEACFTTEAPKGQNSYYLISDGNVMSYRTRIRTPSFPHIQMVPSITRGLMIPDLIAILGSVDFVLADVDR